MVPIAGQSAVRHGNIVGAMPTEPLRRYRVIGNINYDPAHPVEDLGAEIEAEFQSTVWAENEQRARAIAVDGFGGRSIYVREVVPWDESTSTGS